MPFRPAPNSKLIIRGKNFTVCEHPAAPGMAYGQSGRRALVYQLRDEAGQYFALKVFNQTFRTVEIAQSAKNLQNYAGLPGLKVCQRVVLTDAKDNDLLQQYPDLHYAVRMPWVLGRTWQEVILALIAFKPRESYQFANSLVNILAGMERAGVAHCDLSGANVLLPGLFGHQPPVELVDVEEMYLPGAERPAKLPAGTPGYNHRIAVSGLWGAEVDRFAGAVLISEMLGWFDPQVRQAAFINENNTGEQYFLADEMQQPCSRFETLRRSLELRWSTGVAQLLQRAWDSSTLAGCPSFAEWQGAFASLSVRLPALEEMSLPGTSTSHPVKSWRKVTGSVPASDQTIGGRYQILEFFSDGGFGTVYLAADLRDNSRCVLKKNKDSSEESRRQFAREADLLRRLNHPNLVKVLDYLDSPNEGQFIVMEMVHGDDLQTLMNRQGSALAGQAMPYLSQICNALEYLHTQNPPIVHRDVKPANIRIMADGRAVLMDFGIAKIIAPDVRTTIGARAVSPGFSPPEQYGQNSTDVRADVYAFGATVWAVLIGRSPQESVDRMGRDAMFPLQGAVPAYTEKALQRALDLNPACRFASVREFWSALTNPAAESGVYLQAAPVPVTSGQRPSPVWIFVLLGAFSFACITLSILGYKFWPPFIAPTAVLDTSTAPPELPTFTSVPTYTELPTYTPFPTQTAYPTNTSLPVETIPSPPGPSGPAFDRTDPEGFVRWYFDAICSDRDYEYTWQFLTDRFKAKNDPDGFGQYTSFWDTEKKVEIQSVKYVADVEKTRQYEVMAVFYNRNGKVSDPLKLNYYLVFDEETGHWMFDSPPHP